MIYFNGFSLFGEEKLFENWLEKSDFCVTGFSFGAQKAVELALDSNQRIDKLQLFSPAFFNDKDLKFKRMQMMFWNKNQAEYANNFLKNCAFPSGVDLLQFHKIGSTSELDSLLNYVWEESKLQRLIDRNIKIEVFLGGCDEIIDSNKAKEFFDQFAEVYFFKHAGHCLLER